MQIPDLIPLCLFLLGVLFASYTYFGYPAILWLLGRFRSTGGRRDLVDGYSPLVSICVPAFNEESQMDGLIQNLLSLEYPKEQLQILIISDASSDRTDEIVQRYTGSGIELLRLEKRGGKTKAENAGLKHLRGEVIVNTDASIRITPQSLTALVAQFADPEIGLASGRDISVGPDDGHGNVAESRYVGYEMAVRDLETRVSGIVGASGCFYAIRSELHKLPVPEPLSRDFAAALHTREAGFRAVSVPEAICYVPRTSSLKDEYRRKVRTIARGMDTLSFKRALLNPCRYGLFGWMLFSHKVCRWVLPWVGTATFVSLGILSLNHFWALNLFGVSLLLVLLALTGWVLADLPRVPRIFSTPAYVFFGNLAAVHAFFRHLRGDRTAVWEPTRRESPIP